MWQKLRLRASNFILVSIGTAALLFTLVATWVIMQEVAALIRDMSGSMDVAIGGILVLGLILFWMNSIILDSVIWTISSFWKGEDNE
tara:strand:- start:206 stop:466 length:261 start_codon:yes stop_codon:yes gene_type:complete